MQWGSPLSPGAHLTQLSMQSKPTPAVAIHAGTYVLRPQGSLLLNSHLCCYLSMQAPLCSMLSRKPAMRLHCRSDGWFLPDSSPIPAGTSVFYALKEACYAARADAGLTGWFRLDSPATPERLRLACADELTAPFAPPGLLPKISC